MKLGVEGGEERICIGHVPSFNGAKKSADLSIHGAPSRNIGRENLFSAAATAANHAATASVMISDKRGIAKQSLEKLEIFSFALSSFPRQFRFPE
jgi:hypothetical protein